MSYDEHFYDGMKVMTIKELAKAISGELDLHNCRDNSWIGVDFATIDHYDEQDTIEEIYRDSCHWYGMKQVNCGFDSWDLVLVSDYYGGGCARLCQLFDGMDDYGEDLSVNVIMRTIISTIEYDEKCDENTKVIADWKKH